MASRRHDRRSCVTHASTNERDASSQPGEHSVVVGDISDGPCTPNLSRQAPRSNSADQDVCYRQRARQELGLGGFGGTRLGIRGQAGVRTSGDPDHRPCRIHAVRGRSGGCSWPLPQLASHDARQRRLPGQVGYTAKRSRIVVARPVEREPATPPRSPGPSRRGCARSLRRGRHGGPPPPAWRRPARPSERHARPALLSIHLTRSPLVNAFSSTRCVSRKVISSSVAPSARRGRRSWRGSPAWR